MLRELSTPPFVSGSLRTGPPPFDVVRKQFPVQDDKEATKRHGGHATTTPPVFVIDPSPPETILNEHGEGTKLSHLAILPTVQGAELDESRDLACEQRVANTRPGTQHFRWGRRPFE
jgi:hypothetical protein